MRSPNLVLISLRSGESAVFLNGKKVVAAMPGSDLATEAAAAISFSLGIEAKVLLFFAERPAGDAIDWDAVYGRLPEDVKRDPMSDAVLAAHWNSEKYGGDEKTGAMYNFRMSDQRASHGQVFLDVEPVEGHMDDNGIGIMVEVNSTPGADDSHVPCAHLNFGNGNMAFSVFQAGIDKLILRPETNVKLSSGLLQNNEHAWFVEEV